MTSNTGLRYREIGSSTTTPVENTKRKEVKALVPKTESIIFIGSEMYYKSFWLKMMFISAAYLTGDKQANFRPANKKTIAYVEDDYTHLEKLTLDHLRDQKGFEIVKLASSSDIVSCLNKNRDEYKLLDVMFFSHGVVGSICLNYSGDEDIDLSTTNVIQVNKKAFAPNGRIFSFACRTGVAVDDYTRGFKNESDAKPDQSLAQIMANHFGIEVHAFLRRSNYGDVLREKSQSAKISESLRAARDEKDGQVIQLPPDHEALPHPGLGNNLLPFMGPKKEGTDNYSLWRKGGGIRLPVAGNSPEGLPTEMRVFRPKK